MRLKIFVTIALLVGYCAPALAAEQTMMTQKQISDIRVGINNLKTTFLLKHQNQWCKKEVWGSDAVVAECFSAYENLLKKFSALDAKLEKMSWERFVNERDALVPLVDEAGLRFNPDKPKQAASK